MIDRRAHWDQAYSAKTDTEVSWYQPVPERSLALIASAAPSYANSIIDVGAGVSRLAGALLAQGYSDITVLDISAVALNRAKARLGGFAEKLSWIVADVTQWEPQRTWDVWHDRAVFHFLVETAAQDAYIAALRQATAPGSAVILASFALAGPQRCSGLDVQRYSPATWAARLGADFSLCAQAAETHATPFGTMQEFAYAAFRRL